LEAAVMDAGLPADDIASCTGSFYRFAKPLGQTVGYGGLEGAKEHALLRSLVVLPAFRDQGFGKAVALTLERIAATASFTTLHVLTTSAEGLFTKLGYRAGPRESAPSAITATSQFRDLCPASAIYLSKSVRTSW
jgi:amino-acid N-acetyltransferase